MASSYLIVRVQGRLCALPVAQVVETLRTPVLAREQSTVAGWMGTTMLRGQLVAVLDLGALLGFGDAQPQALARAVSLRLGESCALFAVQDVVGVQPLEESRLQTLALPGGAERRMGRFDYNFAQVIEAGGLLSEAAQQQLAAALAAGHEVPA